MGRARAGAGLTRAAEAQGRAPQADKDPLKRALGTGRLTISKNIPQSVCYSFKFGKNLSSPSCHLDISVSLSFSVPRPRISQTQRGLYCEAGHGPQTDLWDLVANPGHCQPVNVCLVAPLKEHAVL